ncbi:coat protein [ssRNA phage Zoerhiza.2_24]|uniref:Coat protein n=2 Tax=Leviviricetes TaxID=2842243 RepID=A0A8S5L2J8_9VIRU|nr:coat protein [ssRNA phage Zoerhiza.2_24]QDH88550.1 MAG: hypothetical protein H2Rhizo33598_000002 [Leviviridae sp.]DAD52046.1 TPA_asm: coat protein [ssRNA phage Zoerhiza.2_24]
MFADTITFTDVHGTEDFAFVRVNQDKYSSEYRYSTDLKRVTLKLRNTSRYDKPSGKTFDRHNVELVETILAVSPSILTTERKVYLTFEVQQGDVLADNVALAVALCGWLTASSAATLVKLTAFES